jgi:MraZ protein
MKWGAEPQIPINQMFRGQFSHAIDPKGRVSFPARFREQLESQGDARLVVAKSLFECCLHVYTFAEWERFVAHVGTLPRLDPHLVRFRRMYIAPALDLEIDAAGRVRLSPEFRAHARMERDVVWSAGSGPVVELWAKAEFDLALQIPAEELSEFAAKVQELIRI